ncbi:uncharacterized protein LOC135499782 [Lineus longissimus]|uniref:uncharacterized protein LOC135499782 n=1 Tax=Lineus longissimus TaxID=88925 RepID=UPI00315CB528
MVLTGDFALVCERSYYESASENDCDLAMVPKEEFFYSSYGYAVQKDNPLKVLLSEQINALSESGVLEKLRKDWTPAQRCNGLTFTQSKPAGLDDTQGGFIVLGFGVGISIIAMITEVIWFYCIRKKVEGKKFGPITFGSRISMRSDNKVRPMTD